MKRGSFWCSDAFLALVVSWVVFLASGTPLIQGLERAAYDLAVRVAERAPLERVAVIAVDEQSIANLGRWPWSRDVHARMADLLAGAGAKVIGNTIFFSEPERPPGYDYIRRMQDLVEQARGEGEVPEPLQPFQALLDEAESALATDRRLAASYQAAGRVALPFLFQLGAPQGRPDQALPEFVSRNQISQVLPGPGRALPAADIQIPIEILGREAVVMGHLNYTPDVDGSIRAEPLVIDYHGQYYPSLALMLAARSLNLGADDIQVSLGEAVRLGRLQIATDADTQMHPFFYRSREGRPAFAVDSFYDVLAGKIPAAKYADKIVLIGATAPGVGSSQVTPVSPAMAPVLTLAHSVSSILQAHFFVLPAWGLWAELGCFVLAALYLILLLPRLSAGMGALLTGLLLAALVGSHLGLMLGAGLWLQLMGVATLLLVGHLVLTTKRFLVTERGKERSEQESAESNRMLGLAFQGQGQLDMAFDKFRKCPLDDGLMENLYNLALDYERKRQFNKAEAVFRYMADYNPDFRDLMQRLARARQMSETVLLAGARGQTGNGTLILGDGQVEKPMLGRYRVEKELGKGAMGVVYQGLDPKINRVVAIKTMALSQEFDPDELEEVKARFFREAETAGRLNHPNIVTIFDAGEEHDLAYIAMEFLKGRDLLPYTQPDQLLPLAKVMDVGARVAEALDYAHRNQVVHRDVKPANIMYEPATDQVKVTDFGIARITDSSRTKTGMVLGTPSYMSPEQLAGKKIDGRSDLYSLGVTLYQLSCGRLPFVGDSMAELMYKIANEAAPPVREFNPAIPGCLAAIIDKAMHKDVAQRYQQGQEMALALRACMAAGVRNDQ